MMGMPIEVRDRWVAALRSGEYEQGRGQLRTGDRYCCLGVLCDVLGTDLDATDREGRILGLLGGLSDGPEVLFAVLPEYDLRRDLSARNDDGDTFAQIADYIEQNVPVA